MSDLGSVTIIGFLRDFSLTFNAKLKIQRVCEQVPNISRLIEKVALKRVLIEGPIHALLADYALLLFRDFY
jgi:hypothetical protein